MAKNQTQNQAVTKAEKEAIDALKARIAELEAELEKKTPQTASGEVTEAKPDKAEAESGIVVVYKVNQDVFPASEGEPILRAPFSVRADTRKTNTGAFLASGVIERLMKRNADEAGVIEEVTRVEEKDWSDSILAMAVK